MYKEEKILYEVADQTLPGHGAGAKKAFVDKIKNIALLSLAEESKRRLLQNFELPQESHERIEQEIKKYREALYQVSKVLATDECIKTITPAHVEAAIMALRRNKKKSDFSDGLLSGGLFIVGLCASPLIIALFDPSPPTSVSPALFLIGLVGAFIFGMGAYGKSKR